jgi:hypothetical protein
MRRILGNTMVRLADFMGKPTVWGNLPEDSRRFKLLYVTYSVGCDLCAPDDGDPRPSLVDIVKDAFVGMNHGAEEMICRRAIREKDGPTIDLRFAPVSPMCDFEQPDGWCGGPDGCTDYHEWLKDQGEDPRIESWWRNR